MKNKRNSKGALPVPYIVALIIAILVIVLLVVWFYLTYGTTNSTANDAICKARAISYCASWAATGYNPDSQPGGKDFLTSEPECASSTWAKSVSPTYCKSLLNPLATQTATQ